MNPNHATITLNAGSKAHGGLVARLEQAERLLFAFTIFAAAGMMYVVGWMKRGRHETPAQSL